ncbi:hypothetical protein WOLCODRAFT_151036 [Wolfiporia cocos MD-104 SS10]|uniref:Uncharacterized protein n=1 Tax=Wolfiporia cocos (strain MD-104) TaxID=742152 RepID=A0A2H3JXV3_WOLCO|nr:hypothetical protein WOLCODRAFT_151036 [Wolfiporia cocos MD-104 SS10]
MGQHTPQFATTPATGLEDNAAALPTPVTPRRHVERIASLLALGSVVFLPYWLIRRRMTRLHLEVARIGVANAALTRDVRALHGELAMRRTENERLVEVLNQTRAGAEALRSQMEKREGAHAQESTGMRDEMRDIRLALERLAADAVQRDHARAEWEKIRREDLRAFLRERQQTRSQFAAVKELGTSLADVAAFMHEVELQQGYSPRKSDGRGIERMRRLAQKLQDLPEPTDVVDQLREKPADTAAGPDIGKEKS